jgi:hypothetical protein
MALRQFGDPRDLARQYAVEWRRRMPVSVWQLTWPAMAIAAASFSCAYSICGISAQILRITGTSLPDWFACAWGLGLLAVAGLATGILAPARPVRGTVYALTAFGLRDLAVRLIMRLYDVHGHHAADVWQFALTRAAHFLLPWVGSNGALMLGGCAATALGAWLRTQMLLNTRRWVLQ